MNILVIGSINVDYVIHTDRLPALGETITGSGFAMNFGGKGANQAVALAKAGCTVKLLGAVGDDSAGAAALANLRAFGVDCDAVLQTDTPTGAAVITVCGGDNHIILDGGANERVTPEVIAARADLFDWADAVVMQYEIPIESVLAAAKTARAHGKLTVLNPAPVKKVPTELYAYIDYLIPNEFEAEQITGIRQESDDDAADAVRALRALGCTNAIVTLGGRGSAFSYGEDVRFGGIYRVARVDTTAAGDSFIGGLCAALGDGAPLPDAIRYAAATAAITVSRHGAGVSIPTRDEVCSFMAQNQDNFRPAPKDHV